MGTATPRPTSVLPEEIHTPDVPPENSVPTAGAAGPAADADRAGTTDRDTPDELTGATYDAAAVDRADAGDSPADDAAPPFRPRRRADRGLPSPAGAARLLAGAALVALVVAVVALAYGDGVPADAAPGLPDPGAVTGWGLPLTRLVAQLAAALVVGTALAAVFRTPGSAVPGFHRRVARGAAAVWTVAAVAGWLFALSDLRGLPVSGVLDPEALYTLGLRTTVGQAALATVAAALAATALCRRTPATTLVVGLVGVLPPVFVGVAVSTADHRPAVAAGLFQTAALTLCLGALAALILRAASDASDRAGTPDRTPSDGPHHAALADAATRYGQLALPAVVIAAVAALFSAYLVLDPTDTGLDSTYGRLIVLLVVALGALVALGRWRTTQTVPALTRGRTDPFVRFAAAELCVLGGVTGLAVALTRTPAPLESGVGVHHESAGQQMLGYDLPPTVSFWQLATDWRPDMVFLVLCAAAAIGYLRLEARAHRAGHGWPARRSAAWLAGIAVVAVATSSGVGRYAPVFFSVTVVQHVLLAIVAPLLLTAAAPLTLALRALRPADASRAWLRSALRSRPGAFVTAPGTVVTLWAAGLAGTYFTGLFETTRWSYAADLAVQAYLLASGCLLFGWLTGPDPRPVGRRTNRARLLVALAAGAAGTLVGLVLVSAPGVVAADWYIGLLRVLRLSWPWGSASVRDDQTVGGTLLAASSAVVFLAIAADRAAAALSARRRRNA